MIRRNSGFTAVELLIAIVVGTLLLIAASQFYSAVLNDSTSVQRRAQANNAAYDLLRQYQQRATTPCTTLSETPTVPSYANLSGSTATAAITCPYSASGAPNLSLVTITISYTNPDNQQVTRALTVLP